MQAIGMHIGSSFAHVGVWDADQPKTSAPKASALFYLPRQNLKTALPKFLATLPDQQFDGAFVTTRFLERLFEFRLGGSTAQLVTSGFEAWPFLSAAPLRTGWVHPQRSLPIASQELSLAVDERTEADGRIARPLDVASLGPFVEKLRAQNVKRVCVHFLHANRNAANQDAAATFLREHGFEVFVPPADDFPESARWRRSTLEASFAGTFEELRTDVESGLKSFVPADRIVYHDGESFRAGTELSRVKALFADDEILCRSQANWVLDLGVEAWRLFRPGRRELWQSPWGPVAIEKPWRRELRWQPTSALEKNEDGSFSPPRKAEGYEPGPLSFGRGQKLLVFDLFHESLTKLPGLSEQMPEAALTRRTAALTAAARDINSGPAARTQRTGDGSGASLRDRLVEQIIRDVITDVKTWTQNEPVILSGIFAESFRTQLAKSLRLATNEVTLPARRAWIAHAEAL